MSHDELRRWANAPTSKPVMGSQFDTPQEWAWIKFGELKKAEVRALLAERDAAVNALCMAAAAAHEFALHGGDIETCVHHPCDLQLVKEAVASRRLAAAVSVTGRNTP